MKVFRIKSFLAAVTMLCTVLSCVDTSSLEDRMDKLSASLDQLEDAVASANSNAIAAGKFLREGNIIIVGHKSVEHGYELELSDGTTVKVTFGKDAAAIVPVIGVDKDGRWVISVDGGTTFDLISGAAPVGNHDGATPQVRISSDGFWEVSMDGGSSWEAVTDSAGKPISATDGASVAGTSSFFKNVVYDASSSEMTFTLQDGRTVKVPVLNSFFLEIKGFKEGQTIHLGETQVFPAVLSEVSDAIIRAPEGWIVTLTDSDLSITAPSAGEDGSAGEVVILAVSTKGYMRKVSLGFVLSTAANDGKTGCKTWDDWLDGSNEMLLDYSYAGFNHGESVPADAFELGYTVYNVMDYGAVPNDGKSDREAVIKAYQAAIGAGAVHNPSARAILYFPEGEFILHTSGDDTDGKSSSILMRAGDFVVKGAGVDKTTLVMAAPNLPASDALYSSPVMLELKHNSGLSELTKVTADAARGSFSVEVASASGIAPGDWVCLSVVNNDAAFVAQELSPYSAESTMTNIIQTGVQVYDYHKVVSVSGSTVTFKEPIMHAVESRWGWSIQKYPHYERVGVEDLTFKGSAKDNFVHHGSWQDDGAFKPLAMTRITDGWLRRVRFTSVSEACTITNSACVSAYDLEINGNRGHSSIRAQQSSRVFIGKVYDHSSGNLTGTSTWREGTGQYHATGVSKPSMGTVLWRNIWGNDSCFEAHATQPRATLVDCCTGGWMQFRQGGDEAQVPNHLGDLVIWNFNSTTPFSGTWDWWKTSSKWWKMLPPVVVGFHGEACDFLSSQTKVDESHGTAVEPESLYEAQLKKRLGTVPSWLNLLK